MAIPWNPDRRRSERRALPFPLYARLHAAAGNAAGPTTVRVSGLSVGGLVLEAPALLPVGDQVALTIEAPGAVALDVGGRVVHTRLLLPSRVDAAATFVTGVAFGTLPAETRAAIEVLLVSIAPDHAQPGTMNES